jgi:hypothetical protein
MAPSRTEQLLTGFGHLAALEWHGSDYRLADSHSHSLHRIRRGVNRLDLMACVEIRVSSHSGVEIRVFSRSFLISSRERACVEIRVSSHSGVEIRVFSRSFLRSLYARSPSARFLYLRGRPTGPVGHEANMRRAPSIEEATDRLDIQLGLDMPLSRPVEATPNFLAYSRPHYRLGDRHRHILQRLGRLIVRGNRPHFPAIPIAHIERVIRLLAIFVHPRPTRCLTRQ